MTDIISYTKEPHYTGDIAALIYGAVLPLAFAPFDLFVIALLSPGLLLLLCLNVTPSRALLRGALYGLGLFGAGTSWIYVSLHVYGQANPMIAGGITGLLTLLMLMFPAVMCYVLNKFFPHNVFTKCVFVYPSLWVLLEWARGWFLTGFPWLFIGYSQIDTPLANLAPVASVYAVSWLTVCTSSVLAIMLLERKNVKWMLPCISTLIIIWGGSWSLSVINWTHSTGDALKVSLIQGNIPQSLKWQRNQAESILATYQNLTNQHLDSQIIIWPEAAITFFQNEIPGFLNSMDQQLKAHQSTLITGIPIYQNEKYYNGMLALGNGTGTYLKRHLVPFGEYMPLRWLWSWLDKYMQIPMSDFSGGPKKQPLIMANGIAIASSICYEIAYPTETLRDLPEGQILVTISDDSWFGKSLAPGQHMQMARMRALETGRYLLMATNDGLSVVVNPKGKIQSFAPPFQEFVLTDTIQAFEGRTLWTLIGIYPLLLLLVILLFVTWRQQRKFKADL